MVKAATAKKPTGKAVARQEAGGGQLPDYLKEYAGQGKENIGREDLETPRLKLIQALSPELESYNDLRPGNFFHTATEHIFTEPFRAVVVYMDKRFMLWNPRESGGGIIARSDDGKHWQPSKGEFKVKLDKKNGGANVTWRLAPTVAESGLHLWGSMDPNDPNSQPAATEMYSYVLAFPDHPDLMPAVLTFQRSSIRQGRKLNNRIVANRAPIFAMVFEFSAMEDTNKVSQKFFNIGHRGDGYVEEADIDKYKEMHESFKQAGLTIRDIESAQDEAVDAEEDKEDKNAKGHKKF